MIGHITSGLRMPDRQWFVFLYVSFNMPLFVILSSYMGYNGLLRIKSLADVVQYLLKVSLHLALPSLLMYNAIGLATGLVQDEAPLIRAVLVVSAILLFYVSLQRYSKVVYASLLFLPLALDTGYWFIGMLIREMTIFMFIYWIVNYFRKEILWWLLSAGALAIAFKFNFGGYTVEFLPYFALGLLLKKYDVVSLVLSRASFFMSAFLILAVALYFCVFNELYFYDNQLGVLKDSGRLWIWPLRLLCGTSWSLFFILLFARLSKRYTLFSFCGTLTMGIYLLQQPVFDNLLCRDVNLELHAVPYWIVAFTIAFCILTAISFFCIWLQRYQVTRDLLLGEIVYRHN